jgi:hypothetical protein
MLNTLVQNATNSSLFCRTSEVLRLFLGVSTNVASMLQMIPRGVGHWPPVLYKLFDFFLWNLLGLVKIAY